MKAGSRRESAVALTGLSCLWMVFSANFFGHLIMHGMEDLSYAAGLYLMFIGAAFVVALLLTNKNALDAIKARGKKPWFPVLLGLQVGAGAALMKVSVGTGLLSPALIPAGGVLVSLGLFGLLPLWAEYLVEKGRKEIFRLLLCSMAVSCVLTMTVSIPAFTWAENVMPAIAAVPGIAYVLLPKGRPVTPVNDDEKNRDFDLLPGYPLSTIRAIMFFMIAGTFSKGIKYVVSGNMYSDAFVFNTSMAILVFVGVAWVVYSQWQNLRRMVGALWAILVCFYLIALLFLDHDMGLPFVSNFVMAARCGLNFLFVLLLALFVRTQRISGRAAFGVFILGQLLGAFIAYCLVPMLMGAGASIDSISLASTVLILVAVCGMVLSLYLVGLASDVQRQRAREPELEQRRRACRRLAERGGLTSRQEEVLVSFSMGYSKKAVADKFVVSEHTIGSHVREIYKAFDVHNQDELIDLVQEEMRRMFEDDRDGE